MTQVICPLCHGTRPDVKFFKNQQQYYWDCQQCRLIYLDPSAHLDPASEIKQYLTHNNDIKDPRYQQFVSPIVNYIRHHFAHTALGLDFGAGSGPVIASMLDQAGYVVNLYDPYFWPDEWPLQKKYDFIYSCEVIEHLYQPAEVFARLRSLLRENAALIMMTEIYQDQDFARWYYHQDPTHVVFYRMETFDWIASQWKFRKVERLGPRLIVMLN